AGDTVQAADAVSAAGPAVQAQVTGAALGVGGAIGVGAGQVCVVGGAHRFPSSSRASLILCSQERPAKPCGATTKQMLVRYLATQGVRYQPQGKAGKSLR